ncbi:hypothetical protein CPAR01_10250, partial [Colletotrichum paranaense]
SSLPPAAKQGIFQGHLRVPFPPTPSSPESQGLPAPWAPMDIQKTPAQNAPDAPDAPILSQPEPSQVPTGGDLVLSVLGSCSLHLHPAATRAAAAAFVLRFSKKKISNHNFPISSLFLFFIIFIVPPTTPRPVAHIPAHSNPEAPRSSSPPKDTILPAAVAIANRNQEET